MNAGIETNGQELDSGFLKIIFNFEIFFREGLEKGKDTKDKIKPNSLLYVIAEFWTLLRGKNFSNCIMLKPSLKWRAAGISRMKGG